MRHTYRLKLNSYWNSTALCTISHFLASACEQVVVADEKQEQHPYSGSLQSSGRNWLCHLHAWFSSPVHQQCPLGTNDRGWLVTMLHKWLQPLFIITSYFPACSWAWPLVESFFFHRKDHLCGHGLRGSQLCLWLFRRAAWLGPNEGVSYRTKSASAALSALLLMAGLIMCEKPPCYGDIAVIPHRFRVCKNEEH